jgi:hypothetical protein
MTSTMIEWWAARKPHFRCPTCGAISFNRNDIRERYCGRCHTFHGDPKPPPKARKPKPLRSKEDYASPSRKTTDDDTTSAITFPTSSPGWTDPSPPSALPDPPSFEPGGGSSGGGGASGDY